MCGRERLPSTSRNDSPKTTDIDKKKQDRGSKYWNKNQVLPTKYYLRTQIIFCRRMPHLFGTKKPCQLALASPVDLVHFLHNWTCERENNFYMTQLIILIILRGLGRLP